jgi:hypothetical protein
MARKSNGKGKDINKTLTGNWGPAFECKNFLRWGRSHVDHHQECLHKTANINVKYPSVQT